MCFTVEFRGGTDAGHPYLVQVSVSPARSLRSQEPSLGVLALGPRRPGPRQYTLRQVELVKYSVGVTLPPCPGHSMAKGTPCLLGDWDSRWQPVVVTQCLHET